VLHLWTGLGYYARARNLHAAARIVAREHGGRFPRRFEDVAHLPGIGPSTAGAILALACGQRHAILDGNVKRVLTRYHAIERSVTERATEQELWRLAEQHTPRARVADYTQAIMDLGATLCTRTRPDCARCPVRTGCAARRLGRPKAFPVRAPRRAQPVRRTRFLMLHDARSRVLLERRPAKGVWGGLWSFPEYRGRNIRAHCATAFGVRVAPDAAWPVRRHTFTHFHLDITPIPVRVLGTTGERGQTADSVWYNLRKPPARGLAAPVKQLLQQLQSGNSDGAHGEVHQARSRGRGARFPNLPGRARKKDI
jgi:A/G-specific adenine glycosylase